MTQPAFRAAAHLAMALALGLTATIANAAVYKCKDSAGKTTYSDLPCDSTGQPLKLADPTEGSKTDPNMCAQLLDEMNRLASQTERNAKQGRKESSDSAKRRNELRKQYAARCVGILRSK
jgi:Domain of unknown function (DUF4124)